MRTTRQLMTACLIAAAALAVCAGCSSEPKDPFEKWDAGMKHEEFVPLTAKPVGNGSGVLEYTAPENGTLYILDTTSTVMIEGFPKPKVVVSGYLPAGTQVIFDPNEKRARVKGREGVGLTEVVPGHNHEMRFDPSKKEKKS